MASQVTTTREGAGVDELRTAGRALPGRELMIAEDHEILVRAGNLDARLRSRQYAVNLPLDAAGWFHTATSAASTVTEELVVIGRRDNLCISGGENIYPEEIELALLALSGVHQAVVMPILHREYGQRPIAFVDGDLGQVDRWRAELAERLPSFKIPDQFLAWPTLTGVKPNRRELQRLAEQANSTT